MAETYEQVEQQRNHFRREVTELSKQRDDLMEQAALHMRQAAELLGHNCELTRQVEQLQTDAHRLECALSEAVIVVERHIEQFALGTGSYSDGSGIPRCWPVRDEYLHHWRKAIELHNALTAHPSSSDLGRADTGREE